MYDYEETNLFNNPMVKAAKEAMTPKQIEEYRLKGESMYKDIDFEKCEVENIPPFFSDAIRYIEELIKSGLHISMLTQDDKNLLKEMYGNTWYLNYGYTKEDLDDIVTIKKN